MDWFLYDNGLRHERINVISITWFITYTWETVTSVLKNSFSLKQPFKGVLEKRCSENMQQIYRWTPMLKCDFNKVAKQLYWNCTSARVFSCKFAAYFQNTFSLEQLRMAATSGYRINTEKNFVEKSIYVTAFYTASLQFLVLEWNFRSNNSCIKRIQIS